MLGPRDRGLAFTTALPRLHPVAPGETIDAAGLSVTGYSGRHGALELRLGPLRLAIRPRPGGRLGHGEMVFEIIVEGRRLVVFGDTVAIPGAWDAIAQPDLALIPIGGAPTMTSTEAAEVVISMGARHVIPCHYDCPALLSRAFNPIDPVPFCARIAAAGLNCHLLRPGESVDLDQGL